MLCLAGKVERERERERENENENENDYEESACFYPHSTDSTVLAHVLTYLNAKYSYGLSLFLLSIDEGIKGYRDDSLEVTHTQTHIHYYTHITKNLYFAQSPLLSLSRRQLSTTNKLSHSLSSPSPIHTSTTPLWMKSYQRSEGRTIARTVVF